MATVRTGCRIHVGFQNLSLAHRRLYGGIGIGLAEPSTVVRAERADELQCEDDLAREYARRATALLSVPGVSVTVEQSLPRHVGLGSGTQLALGVYAAVAKAYGRPVDVREAAPALGRGGRSGIGVATFETGGLIVDGGHPTAQFTTDRPDDGEWSVPPVVASVELPEHWRVLLAIPDCDRGRHDQEEAESMAAIVDNASPDVADQVAATLTRRLLPAAASGDREATGAAIAEIGRLNGAWYADEQGGVFRPPIGTIVEHLRREDAVTGVGQSSWGPTVYGLTNVDRAAEARDAARRALDVADLDGDVMVVPITPVQG